ncbi:MAG: acyltransferase family protein [Eubacteriales bacterium]|nr:acyltransferase family protein [Eubacteriales bacterium]
MNGSDVNQHFHTIKKEKTDNKREYLFDNYKVLLILMVVMGHFIEPCTDNNTFLYELKWIIFSVHMPAFVFVSGYFSKKDPSMKKLVKGLVIPYFVYEIIYYLLYTFVLHKSTGLYFARPKFSLWYLMALFVWKLATPYVKKIPFYLMISIGMGLIVGLFDIGNFLTIPRIVFFFPFFLAGTEFDSSIIIQLRDRFRSAAAFAILTAMVTWLFVDNRHHNLSVKVFYGRQSYDEIGLDAIDGILIRCACYLISFILIYLLMFIVPAKKKRYSYLGQRTMPVYIFHGMIYSCLEYGTSILQKVESAQESAVLLTACVALVWVLGQKPFFELTNRISNLI